MSFLGALICAFRGHKWRLSGMHMGYVKEICYNCKRTKHTKITSSWWEFKQRHKALHAEDE